MQQPIRVKAQGGSPGPLGDWREQAACEGVPTKFFDPWDSDDRAAAPNRVAASYCGGCPVRRQCLIEALRRDEPFGTWGGLTRRQRKALVRARSRTYCPVCHAKLIVASGTNFEVCAACGISWRTRNVPR